MDAHPLLKEKTGQNKSSSFSAVFVGNSVTPISTLVNNKRLRLLLIFQRKFCHDFVTSNVVLYVREQQAVLPD